MPLHISEVMTKKLVTFHPDANLYEVMRDLIQHAISGGPVTDENGKLVGVISETDCLKVVVNDAFDDGPPAIVGQYMTTEVISLPPTAEVITAAELFLRHPIRRIPVLDGDKLVGQVSRRNVIQAILERGATYRWRSPTDDASQQGQMAGNSKNSDVVGPATNRRF